MHGDGRHVRACRHGGDGQTAAAEVEVGAVGLVGEAEHPGVVGHLDDGTQIRTDAVIGGVVHQHGHSVGVLLDGFCHLLPLHAQRDAEALVHFGIDIDRHCAAEHQCVQHAAVDVAGENDLIAPLADRQHHALHRAGGAAHHQKSVCCAEGVGGQLLGLPDDRYRVAEIVQRFHAVDVHTHALLAQKGRQLRVAPAALVARHIEGDHPHLSELLQSLVDRCAALVQPEPCTVLTHVFSSVPDSCCKPCGQTKKHKPCTEMQACALKKPFERADKASGAKTPEPYRSMIHQDSKGRDDESLYSNYTFTTLIDRFTSLRTLCAISWL